MVSNPLTALSAINLNLGLQCQLAHYDKSRTPHSALLLLAKETSKARDIVPPSVCLPARYKQHKGIFSTAMGTLWPDI